MRGRHRRSLPVLLLLLGASHAFGQGAVKTIGLAGFRDETGTNAPPEVREKLAGALQQSLNQNYKDQVLARRLTVEGAPAVEQLAMAGKQEGMKFVVRGGLLALGASSVSLYADVISVETGAVTTVRADGEAADADASLTAAIASLATSIQGVVTGATAANTVAAPTGQGGDAPAEQPPNPDEELWQLVSRAEGILGSPEAISEQALGALKKALERLNASLGTKAAVVAKGGDTSGADREIAQRVQDLQSALTTAEAEAAAAQQAGTPPGEPSAEKKSLLASIDELLGGATSTLQRFQELRTAWDGAHGGSNPTGGPGSGDVPYEEVTGAVTENGEPVENVTVTDPDSGATTTTDENGSFTLRAVPGRTTRLALTKKGKPLGSGRVVVLRGRPAVADFELKPRVASRPGFKVMPSTVLLKSERSRAGTTGTLSGVVRDAAGRPLPRALVSLRGIAAARTDSQGRYSFIGVPAGSHQLTVYRPGLKAQSQKVKVAARQTSQSPISLAFADPKPTAAKPEREPLPGRPGSTTTTETSRPTAVQPGGTVVRRLPIGGLRGQVVDARTGSPIPGAIILLPGAGRVETNGRGSFALDNVRAGVYQVVVTRSGYADARASLTIQAGQTATLNLRLSPRPVPQVRPITPRR